MKVRLARPIGMESLNGIVDDSLYIVDGQFIVTSDVVTIKMLVEDYGYHFYDVQDGGDPTIEFKLIDFNAQRNDIRLDEVMRDIYHSDYRYVGVKILKVLLVRHSEPVKVEPIKQRRFTVGWAG